MQGPIISQINNEIDECLLQSLFEKSTSNDSKLFCRRATSSSADLEKAHSYVFASSLKGGYESPSSKKETTTKNVKIHQTTEETTPPHYTIFCEERIRNSIGHEIHQLRGVVIWYFGYSTWKGKVMNVDCIVCDNDIAEKLLIYAIVTIAKRLGLGRVVYQVQGLDNSESLKQKYNFDILNEWLTLQMPKNKIDSFLDTIHTWDAELNNKNKSNMIVKNSVLNCDDIHSSIDERLSEINPAMDRRKSVNGRFQLRRATSTNNKDDAKAILNLVQGLAMYEKALDEVEVNESTYQVDGSGDHPLYHCILLERYTTSATKEVVGMGCFYFGYKFDHLEQKEERFLFLEDLFIEKQYRGNGFGKAIMYSLAMICKALDCNRFVWQALDWNTPSLNFYHSIGAGICDGLMTLRLDKKRLEEYIY